MALTYCYLRNQNIQEANPPSSCSYFGNSSGTPNPNRSSLNKIFDKYRDDATEEPDEINVEGTSALFEELQIGLEDVAALIYSEIVKSPSLGRITRQGFIDGWSDLSVDSLPKMKNCVLQRRSELGQDLNLFKNVYGHTFQIALEQRAKTLPLEMAVEFWKMLFTAPGYEWKGEHGTPWLEWWLEFQEAKRTKAVNKDLWKQTLNFAIKTVEDESLSFWSEESSWPSVIDEFVEWVKTEKRPNGGEGGEAMELA